MDRHPQIKIITKSVAIKPLHLPLWLVLILISSPLWNDAHAATGKQTIKALYIPLADHYAALVAYERYRGTMKKADLQIKQMKNWDLLWAYFQSGEVVGSI